MRSHTATELQATQGLQKQIDDQAASFKSCFRDALNEAKSVEDWTSASKEALCDMVNKIFREFAVIDIPSDVFEDLLGDLPFFVCTFMPPFDPLKGAELSQNVMSWYIWNAMTVALPDTTERRVIESQVHKWADGIENDIHSLTARPRFEVTGSEYAERFLKCYAQAKENRFVPYFKRVLPDHQMRASEHSWARRYRDILESWKRNCAEMESLPTKQQKDREYIQQHKSHAWLAYAFRFNSFAQHCRGTRLADLPGRKTIIAEGELNDNWFWVSYVTRVKPRP